MRESHNRKVYLLGTHRTRHPAETWERIRPLLARAGVVRVADVTGLDRLGIPVYQAVRPASRNICVSQGKGVDALGAKVSAVMETIEHWHAECLDHVPWTRLSLREMVFSNPITTDELHWLPEARRLEAMPLIWVRGHSFVDGGRVWVPRAMVELDFSLPATLRPQMFHRSSNGVASGNTLAEAQVHGLCEVIERHGLFLANAGEGHKVPIDLSSVDSESCRDLVARIEAAGAKLSVFDLTWAVGVPVLFAELVMADLPRVWIGSGCHPCPAVALSRALTEAAQSRLTYISGARDDLVLPRADPVEHVVFERYRPPDPRRRFDQLEDLSTDDVEEDLQRLVRRLVAAGYHPYWIDLSHPDLDVAVIKALVLGLREAHHA